MAENKGKSNQEITIGSGTLNDGTLIVNLGNRDLDISGTKIPSSRFYLFSRVRAEGKKIKGNFFVKRQGLEVNPKLVAELETYKAKDAIFVSTRDEIVLQLSEHVDIYWLQFIGGDPVLVEYAKEA